jgi:transaldolase
MSSNPLKRLGTLGQSIWLDYIRRDLIARGRLRHLIEEDGLRGMTLNPSIFEKAIADSHDYDEDISAMALKGKGADAIYETLSQGDVETAADADKTIEDARRLWAVLNRPNVLIKVPATANGVPAIRQLVGEGISVNVTLLFGLPRYRQVAKHTSPASKSARPKEYP